MPYEAGTDHKVYESGSYASLSLPLMSRCATTSEGLAFCSIIESEPHGCRQIMGQAGASWARRGRLCQASA